LEDLAKFCCGQGKFVLQARAGLYS